MKRIILAVCGAVVFAGCVDRISDVKGPGTPEAPLETKSLAVPASFDWKTTGTVECDVTAAVPAVVSVAFASGEKPFASFAVGDDAEKVVLDIPASTGSLYVSYRKADGSQVGKTVAVSNGKISFAIGADAAPAAMTRGGGNDYDKVIYVPAVRGGWGTLMFEDLWPAYGDYDFNDFVLNYKIQLYANNKNMVRWMQIGVRVKAIGGTLPYTPHLRMKGVKGGEIAEIEDLSREAGYGGMNVPDDAELVQLNPGNNVKDPAVLEFRGISTKKHAPVGSAYLNTERGQEMADDDLITVVYFIELRNSVAQSGLTFDSFDFFLSDADGKEIHFGGVEPTAAGMAVYERESKNANTVKAPTFYYSNDRMVWAINIPENIPHAYEDIDFLKAYPDFAEWVQSGGNAAKDWYEHGEKANLVSRK